MFLETFLSPLKIKKWFWRFLLFPSFLCCPLDFSVHVERKRELKNTSSTSGASVEFWLLSRLTLRTNILSSFSFILQRMLRDSRLIPCGESVVRQIFQHSNCSKKVCRLRGEVSVKKTRRNTTQRGTRERRTKRFRRFLTTGWLWLLMYKWLFTWTIYSLVLDFFPLSACFFFFLQFFFESCTLGVALCCSVWFSQNYLNLQQWKSRANLEEKLSISA